MIILSIDSGKNCGLCLNDTKKNSYLLQTLIFKTSQEAFLNFEEKFEHYLEHNVTTLDKVVIEFSQFGIPNAQLSHFFYITTIYKIITKIYGEGVFHLFVENKNSKWGVSPSTWQSYISGLLKIKPKQFDKSTSINFANSILKKRNCEVSNDHEADSFCIGYWFKTKYLNEL